VLSPVHSTIQAVYVMTFFDCTAHLIGQLNGNGQKGMLQIDAPPVENFWLRHCIYQQETVCSTSEYKIMTYTGRRNIQRRVQNKIWLKKLSILQECSPVMKCELYNTLVSIKYKQQLLQHYAVRHTKC